jgi:hypothetical protein
MEDSALQRKTLMEYAANKRISPQPQAAQASSMQNQSFVPQPQSVGESLMQGSTPQMSMPQPQAVQKPQAQPSSKSSMIQQQIDKLYNQADYFDSKGVQGGDIYRDKAIELEKLKPKFSTEYRVGKDEQGNIVNTRLADDGTEQASPYGVAEKLNWSNNGGVTTGNDAYTGKTVRSITNSQSADSVSTATNSRLDREQRAEIAKQNQVDGILPSDAITMMAQQARAGDTSVFQNLGRGAQGAQNIVALRKEITRLNLADGKTGADSAASNAEFIGMKSGQRTVGTKTANIEMAADEAKNMIPIARAASAEVARSGFLPFGKVQIMFDDQTNDPALRKFAAANNTLVNVYSRAVSPSGVPAVADKEHARAMLANAHDQTSYNATLDMMDQEIRTAQASPKHVRQAMHDAITGNDLKSTLTPNPKVNSGSWGIERVN